MKKVDDDVLMDWWLNKYHNTSIKEVVATHPVEVLMSSDWFKLYPVTQEQYDEWVKWAKGYIKKETKLSTKMVDRNFWSVELNCSPYVKKHENEE